MMGWPDFLLYKQLKRHLFSASTSVSSYFYKGYRSGVVECLPQVMRVLLMDAPRHVLAAESKVHQVDQVLALLSQTNQQVRGLQRKDTVILGIL